jgi:hypothetical protein
MASRLALSLPTPNPPPTFPRFTQNNNVNHRAHILLLLEI